METIQGCNMRSTRIDLILQAEEEDSDDQSVEQIIDAQNTKRIFKWWLLEQNDVEAVIRCRSYHRIESNK